MFRVSYPIHCMCFTFFSLIFCMLAFWVCSLLHVSPSMYRYRFVFYYVSVFMLYMWRVVLMFFLLCFSIILMAFPFSQSICIHIFIQIVVVCLPVCISLFVLFSVQIDAELCLLYLSLSLVMCFYFVLLSIHGVVCYLPLLCIRANVYFIIVTCAFCAFFIVSSVSWYVYKSLLTLLLLLMLSNFGFYMLVIMYVSHCLLCYS